MEALTPSELEVLKLRAAGLPIKAVANRLGKSSQTVKNQCSAAFRKLDVGNLTEAMAALGWTNHDGQRRWLERLIALEEASAAARVSLLRAELEANQ